MEVQEKTNIQKKVEIQMFKLLLFLKLSCMISKSDSF